MKVTKVKYKGTHKNDGGKSSTPRKITVEMNLVEAVLIAKVVGAMNHLDGDEIIPLKGGNAVSEIYYCLTGEVFNKNFYDGVDDAQKLVSK